MNKLFVPALGTSLLCFAASNYYFWVDMAMAHAKQHETALNILMLVLLSTASIASFFAIGIGRLLVKKYSLLAYALTTLYYLILVASGATTFAYDMMWITDAHGARQVFVIALLALIALEFVIFKGVRHD